MQADPRAVLVDRGDGPGVFGDGHERWQAAGLVGQRAGGIVVGDEQLGHGRRRRTPVRQIRPVTGASSTAGAIRSPAGGAAVKEPSLAGTACDAAMAVAHWPMRSKRRPTTSQTASAGASTTN